LDDLFRQMKKTACILPRTYNKLPAKGHIPRRFEMNPSPKSRKLVLSKTTVSDLSKKKISNSAAFASGFALATLAMGA